MTRTTNRGLGQPPFAATGFASTTNVAVALTYPAFAEKFFVPRTANGLIDLAISITQGGSQTINATLGGAAANQGVPGTFRVRVATHAGGGVNQSKYGTGPTTLLKVALSVGVDSQFINTFKVAGVQHFITVDFFGWGPPAPSRSRDSPQAASRSRA